MKQLNHYEDDEGGWIRFASPASRARSRARAARPSTRCASEVAGGAVAKGPQPQARDVLGVRGLPARRALALLLRAKPARHGAWKQWPHPSTKGRSAAGASTLIAAPQHAQSPRAGSRPAARRARASTWGRLRGVRPQREGLDAVEEGQQRRRRAVWRRLASGGSPPLPRVLLAPEAACAASMASSSAGSAVSAGGGRTRAPDRRRCHGDGGRGLGRVAVALRARPQISGSAASLTASRSAAAAARACARHARHFFGERRRRVRRRRRRWPARRRSRGPPRLYGRPA